MAGNSHGEPKDMRMGVDLPGSLPRGPDMMPPGIPAYMDYDCYDYKPGDMEVSSTD